MHWRDQAFAIADSKSWLWKGQVYLIISKAETLIWISNYKLIKHNSKISEKELGNVTIKNRLECSAGWIERCIEWNQNNEYITASETRT